MSDNLSNFIHNIKGLINESKQERLLVIEEKNQFREPESKMNAWIEVAIVIKQLPIEEVALILQKLSDGIHFTNEEKAEIRRSLLKNLRNIEKMIVSAKLIDSERGIVAMWKEHNESAFKKLNLDDFE